MWPLTALELADILGATLEGDPSAHAEGVLPDSRAGVRPHDLFFGLQGPHFDGGQFALSALEEGASIAVVAGDLPLVPGPGQAVLRVAEGLAALQCLAAEARRRFQGTVVAITGSNGKTTVKDMLGQALAPSRRIAASPRSYNSQVGVPLSLLLMEPQAEVALIECGISLPGEMALLERIVRPDFGIFTNVGDAHLEGLGNRRVTASEKAGLFRRLPVQGWVLTPSDQGLAREGLAAVGATTVAVGDVDAEFRLLEAPDPPGLLWQDQEIPLHLSIPSPFLIRDAALAAAAALLLGGDAKAIASGLNRWSPAPMRLEMSTTPRGVLLINDAYTADPTSVEAALQVLRNEGSDGATIAVLAGMAQLGEARRAAHRRVGQRVVDLGIDQLVGVGEGGQEIAVAALEAGLPPTRVHRVPNTEEAAAKLEELCRPGDRVLLKGSRPEGLERVAAALFDALAPARLYVDLDAVVENYRGIRRAVGPATGVMAVVKSFGYGLDAVRIARALERAGIDYLAVAYPDEGVELRHHGITSPILVQNVLASEAEKIVRHGLTAQVSCRAQLENLESEASAQRRVVRLHLKVDTGMARAGAAVDEVEGLARHIKASSWLSLEGLMTHFAAAEDPAQDEFTHRQIQRFENARRGLARAGARVRWEHAANSAAIVRFPEAHYSLVRTGMALFGYGSASGPAAFPQRPVLRLVTQVISVKNVGADKSIGYGRTFNTGNRSRRVALVALGYNDGYPWALSNKGWMRLHGERCPVVDGRHPSRRHGRRQRGEARRRGHRSGPLFGRSLPPGDGRTRRHDSLRVADSNLSQGAEDFSLDAMRAVAPPSRNTPPGARTPGARTPRASRQPKTGPCHLL